MRLELRDAAVRVVDVAEDNGAGRARLLAGSLQGTVFNVELAILADGRSFSIDAGPGNALNAVGALLHHAPAAHGDFGIAHELVLRCIPILEQEEVKAPHFVRTVVGAVARPDAAVVDLVVKTFAAMGGSANRTDQLTRSVFALHAGHGLEVGLGCIAIALVVGVDADPVHVAALDALLFADHGDVVLRHAGDDAVVASDAGIQIDRHAPGIGRLGIIVVGIEREFARRRRLFGREPGILAVLVERSIADDGAQIAVGGGHRLIALGRGELIAAAGLGNFAAGGNPQGIGGAQGIDIEAGARAGAARLAATITKMHGYGIIGMARLDPNGAIHLASVQFDGDDLHDMDAFALGHLRAHKDGVIPNQLRHGLGQFLQPAIIGEAAVVDAGVAAEIDVDRIVDRRGRR